MNKLLKKDRIGLDIKSLQVVKTLLYENPEIKKIFEGSETELEVRMKLREWVVEDLNKNPLTKNYYLKKARGMSVLKRISFRDKAALRLMDYLDNEGRSFHDPNRNNKELVSSPIKNLWLAVKYGKGAANEDFFLDMLYLFRQINGRLSRRIPNKEQILNWMERHPSGLEDDMIRIRKKNKERILRKIIRKIEKGEMKSKRFYFEDGLTEEEKYQKAQEWWNDHRFHLVFAIRSPELLNEMLDYSLRDKTVKLLKKAKAKGIPIFINPYYLSLISVEITPWKTGGDKTLRDYIFANNELINAFGNIHAWEKEDMVQPGEPNAAGWLLPLYPNIHRRYPEVAIFIPDTAGRACGGLCVSCQRMYDFQSGRFNFNLEKLNPKITWPEKMKLLLKYWESDTQLRDILITGGDAFMNSDESLKMILDEVYNMALRKKKANLYRPQGKKFAEIIRVRLGTRLPVYLPQRITSKLVNLLKAFKTKASEIGIRQFVVQTHIESAMEITPEAKKAIYRLTSAGWLITNQLVFTAAASRRGHTAKLRKVLNDIGVIPYYTFTVKGYMENHQNFATNERSVQERTEEKYLGRIYEKNYEKIQHLTDDMEHIIENLNGLRQEYNTPFIACDRSVLNLPGVGKSMTYRTIGITDDGRRILEFDHDTTRKHSPIIGQMGTVIIIESKSINSYLKQMEKMGEDIRDYKTIWGYSESETEKISPLYLYPDYDFRITEDLTHFMLEPKTIKEEELILKD